MTPTGQPLVWPTLALGTAITGFASPVYIGNAGDGSGRMFVVEQGGRIIIVRNGVRQTTPFLDITARVTCCGEQGLLSFAFPPDYGSKRYFYVNYTGGGGETHVSRFHLTDDDDVADSTSEEILLVVAQPFANHNGGQLAFGPDGYLYIGMGDGGSGGDPDNRAQDPGELLGKMLRIDVEAGAATYAIPPDNPFVDTLGYRDEIWAIGYRNPWRFGFDRGTGDLYVGDVGQGSFEEVDVQPASSPGGENYGWRLMEGLHCYNPNPCDMTGLTLPVIEYPHGSGNCSITGGYVYRGPTYARMQGVYFFGDYCSGRIWGLQNDGAAWQMLQLFDAPFNISSFGEDESGNVWVANLTNGTIVRLIDLQPTPTHTPIATPTDPGSTPTPEPASPTPTLVGG